MKRVIYSLLISFLLATIPMLVMWLGGHDFIRGESLADHAVISMMFFFIGFFLAVSYPGWEKQ